MFYGESGEVVEWAQVRECDSSQKVQCAGFGVVGDAEEYCLNQWCWKGVIGALNCGYSAW